MGAELYEVLVRPNATLEALDAIKNLRLASDLAVRIQFFNLLLFKPMKNDSAAALSQQ
jgi:hypothetical protein